MRFAVAGIHHYRVLIPRKPIFNETGDELEGLAIEASRMILISPTVQPDRREEILGHELAHCWEFHVPRPRTDEERCQLFATVAQAMRADLDAQGGVIALAELMPEDISLPFRPATERHEIPRPSTFKLSDFRRCGRCDAPTMCGSISNGDPEYHQGLSQHQVLRWFKCDDCGTLMVWREVATSDGRPTGILVEVPAPRMLSGREASTWLADNAAIHC